MGFHHYMIEGQEDSCSCPGCGSSRVHRLVFWHLRYSWTALFRFTICTLSIFSLWFTAYLPWATGLSGAEIIAMIVNGAGYRGHIFPVLAASSCIGYLFTAVEVKSLYPADYRLSAIHCDGCKTNILIQRKRNSKEA